jgi:steroid 5-alpha reductase family enzyme
VDAARGDIGGTLVIYVFSRLSGNASFYDPYWSLAPMVIVLYWFFAFSPSSAPVVRQIAVLLLVLVWGNPVDLQLGTAMAGTRS